MIATPESFSNAAKSCESEVRPAGEGEVARTGAIVHLHSLL